jgi:hypothetical protein
LKDFKKEKLFYYLCFQFRKKHCQNENDEAIAEISNEIGIFHLSHAKNKSDLDQAKIMFQMALDIRLHNYMVEMERSNKNSDIWEVYSNLGILFNELAQYDFALFRE